MPKCVTATWALTGTVYVSQGERGQVWDVMRGRAVVAARTPGLVTESHFFAGEGHVFKQRANIAKWHAEVIGFFQRNLARAK